MKVAKIQVARADARKMTCERLTSGMVGAEVIFSFDACWDGLSKIAVFRAGLAEKDVAMKSNAVRIPHEVLENPATALHVGVYGTNSDGTIVIPTVWVSLGRVEEGADPTGDPSINPTPEVWAQILAMIGDLSQLTTEAKENLVSAVNEIMRTIPEGAPDTAVVSAIGDLKELATETKVSLVAAVNEIAGMLGDLSDLNTEDRESLVAAVNKVWEKTGQMDEKKVQQLLGQYLAENPQSYEALLAKPTINGVTLSGNTTTAELGIGLPTDDQVETAVAGWLTEHPEATTTVEDGSITKEKLASGAVTFDKLADSVFAIGKECVVTIHGEDHAMLGLDLSPLGDYVGKTAVIEYYFTILGDNLQKTELVNGLGNSLVDYAHLGYGTVGNVIDEINKIYRVTGTYSLDNGGFPYLLLCPKFFTTDGSIDVKIHDVSVMVDGVKLEWVEAGTLVRNERFEITGMEQEGRTVAKLEHVQRLIKESLPTGALSGKKWGVVGDSITFGTGTTDTATTYHKFVSERCNMSISNHGYPGRSIALRPEYNDTLISNLQETPEDCDYVTVFGGTNDYGLGIAIGTFNDTTNETFYGALKIMCDTLYSKFGTKKFAFFTPTQRRDGNVANSASHTLKDYRDAIIDVCGRYGVPVLDLYGVSGINPDAHSSFTPDGLHLNDAGHERISNMIAKFLEQL